MSAHDLPTETASVKEDVEMRFPRIVAETAQFLNVVAIFSRAYDDADKESEFYNYADEESEFPQRAA